MSEIENNIVAEKIPPVDANPSDSVDDAAAEHNDALDNVVAAAGDVNANATSASETHAAEPEPIANEISPKLVEKKTPVKRTPSKRLSAVERAQKESEEIVRNMGGSIELEGGRRTRSSSRGTPSHSVITPPPAKKPRASPGSAKTTPAKSTPKAGRAAARARGRIIEIADLAQNEETTDEDTIITDAPAEPVKPAEEVVDIAVEAKEIVDEETPEIENTIADEDKPASALEKQKEIVEEEKPVETAANNETEINTAPSDVADSAELPADAQTPEIIEETPVEPKAIDSMDVDEVNDDAVEPAVEATEVATASTVVIAVEEEAKNNSTINEVAVTQQLNKLEPPKIVIEGTKSDEESTQTTPEAMEVDSNSKSNDSDVVTIETPIDDISRSVETPAPHVNNTTTVVVTATAAEITKSDILEVPKPPPANNGIETAAALENNITPIADGVVKPTVEVDAAIETNVQNKQDAGESNCGEPKITNYTAVSAASE